MAPLSFRTEPRPAPGAVLPVADGVRRLVAPNPSAFTCHGTNTYLVGCGSVAVIDPGPSQSRHLAAILAATEGERITHILVTHTHRDHAPLSRALRETTGAPILGFGPHPPEAGAESGDPEFRPDTALADGDVVAGDGWALEAIHTPGHMSNHLCFALKGSGGLFSGDHVMGWSTSMVLPPDGEMAAYRAALARLQERPETLYWPGHGPAVPDAPAWVAALRRHRDAREAQILEGVAAGAHTVATLVERTYPGLDAALVGGAHRSTLAHLIELAAAGRIVATPDPPTLDSVFVPA